MPAAPLVRRALSSGLLTGALVFSASFPGTTSVAGATGAATTHTVSRAATAAQRDSIFRLYRAYFLRNPDNAGLNYWAEKYASGQWTLSAISEFFASSPEFKSRYGSLTNAQFVNLIYRNVLGRNPDAGGQSHWVQRLSGGTSRGAVMIGFSESPEFIKKTGTRAPGPAAASWMTEMAGLVNSERGRRGLGPLQLCAPLNSAAQTQSNHQARIGAMTHIGPDGHDHTSRVTQAGYQWTWSGENVAAGGTTFGVAAIFGAWVASNGHLANIINPNFEHLGLARSTGADGTVYWTQVFAAGGTC